MKQNKKNLKVKNIYANNAREGYFSHHIADELQNFVEKKEYEKIVKIFIYGESNQSLVCSIVYEEIVLKKNL